MWRSRRKLVGIAALVAVIAAGFALRSFPLVVRQTNRAILVDARIVVFPVCEYSTLLGYREGFPSQQEDGRWRC